MKTTLFSALVAIATLAVPTSVAAQQRFEGEVGADVISHYMWRGQDKGGFSVQPSISGSWQGLSLNVLGSTGFSSDDAQEIDLNLNYERWGVNIGVTDYWETGIDENNRYLHVEKDGAHLLEGNIGYTCKYFGLQAYTLLWGDDYKWNGERAYSTYVELSVPLTLGGIDWQLRGGFTPFESAGVRTPKTDSSGYLTGKYDYFYFYAEGFACVEAALRATKTLDIGFSKLPVFAELNVNPYLQTAQMVFGVTIRPF
jgi:hypothetical protein